MKISNTSLVIFDLDKTLAKSNVSFMFGSFLFSKRKLSFFTAFRLSFVYLLQKFGCVSLDTLHLQAFRHLFLGKKKNEIQMLVDQFLSKNKGKLFRKELICILNEVKEKKIDCWIQSSSPDFIVEPIAKMVGISSWFASKYSIDSAGYFIELSDVVDGKKKKEQLENHRSKFNDVMLFTDSYVDLPIIELVGMPVIVNGDKKLVTLAKKRGWTVISLKR